MWSVRLSVRMSVYMPVTLVYRLTPFGERDSRVAQATLYETGALVFQREVISSK